MKDLEAKDWPRLKIALGACETLGELIYHLRNGAAHGHIEFLSDSPQPWEVAVIVRDRPMKPKNGPFTFRIELTSEQTGTLCDKIIESVDQIVN